MDGKEHRAQFQKLTGGRGNLETDIEMKHLMKAWVLMYPVTRRMSLAVL